MKVIATNKRAHFEYFVLQKFVAGVSLVGSEVKSIRANHTSINDAFIIIRNEEAYINNMYVKTYESAGHFAPEERRARKLLLNKSEILELQSAVKEKGLTIVPLKLFFERSLVKLEIAICRGKKLHDKRETIKNRDIKRDTARELKSTRF
ncbi:MAG: SsrA-binding protein SmpB [Clostridia bacterium]|nr:SsrA-binding protein SmpB [Clostridia bacterium]